MSTYYTAREYDSETGLYYYRARYYDAKAGRFISEDPIGLLGGINLYSYVKNNPVNMIDPRGLKGAGPGTVVRSMCIECDLSALWECAKLNLAGAFFHCFECISGIISSRGGYYPPSCANCPFDLLGVFDCIDKHCSNTYIVEWDVCEFESSTDACKYGKRIQN